MTKHDFDKIFFEQQVNRPKYPNRNKGKILSSEEYKAFVGNLSEAEKEKVLMIGELDEKIYIVVPNALYRKYFEK